jgi:hypothetical protein
VKDFIEPFLYPHNLFFWGLVFAAIHYRKVGLWLLVLWFYIFGNGYVANQVRSWYYQQVSSASVAADFRGDFVVLGCGGTESTLPDCAKNRLDQVAAVLSAPHTAVTVHMTTRYCQPYVDYLRQKVATDIQLNCFHGGDTTYHEFYSLNQKLNKQIPLVFISSDYHAYRIHKLAAQYQFEATVVAAPSSTFRQVNCGLGCFMTVNLSNFDLFAKLTAEMSSYFVYWLTQDWVSWE